MCSESVKHPAHLGDLLRFGRPCVPGDGLVAADPSVELLGADKQAFTLEEAVRMLTFDNASAWELPDRGLLRTGYAADLVVFDERTVKPQLPTVEHDLPGGARRLVQKADGIAATVVNGVVAIENGEATGNAAGIVLKGRLAA